MKIYLTIFLSLLVLPTMALAANNDVTLSGSTVVTVGGYNLTVSGSVYLDSITVNADNLSLVLSKGASFSVTSSDRRSFTVSPAQYMESFTCGSSESSLIVSNNIWDSTITVTVTPSSGACAIGGGGGAGGGGGGGGGGSATVPIPAYTVIQGTSSASPAAALPAPAVVAPSPIAVSVSAVFVSPLYKGKSNLDVKRLQQLLNTDPDTMIASSGAGSSGSETNYFGSLTEKAVQKFQLKYGVVSSASDSGYGYVGPKTRAKFQEVFSGATAVGETGSTLIPAPAPTANPNQSIDSEIQAQLEAQIQLLLQQLEQLQAELNAMQ